MPLIEVFGDASQSLITTIIISNEYNKLTILELLESKGVPIASSCKGEQVCKKCVFNEYFLACEVLVEDFLKKTEKKRVSISYL